MNTNTINIETLLIYRHWLNSQEYFNCLVVEHICSFIFPVAQQRLTAWREREITGMWRRESGRHRNRFCKETAKSLFLSHGNPG